MLQGNCLELEVGAEVPSGEGNGFYKVGELISNTGARKVFSVFGDQDLVLVENTDKLPIRIDPKQGTVLKGKGYLNTQAAVKNFTILEQRGVKTIFRAQLAGNIYLAERTRDFPLKLVHRWAVPHESSYNKRNPGYIASSKEPFRFVDPLAEVFLLTWDGEVINKPGILEGRELTVKTPVVVDPRADIWELYHPEKPYWDGDLKVSVEAFKIIGRLPARKLMGVTIETAKIFSDLWRQRGFFYADGTVSCGISCRDGVLCVSSEVTADSCRIYTPEWDFVTAPLFDKKQGMVVEDSSLLSVYSTFKEQTDMFE